MPHGFRFTCYIASRLAPFILEVLAVEDMRQSEGNVRCKNATHGRKFQVQFQCGPLKIHKMHSSQSDLAHLIAPKQDASLL